MLTCEACTLDRPYVSRIRSPSHVFLALRLLLTDKQRQRQLFTNWIHVPLGITSLLFLVWCIKQAMDRAPFRFPSPVLAMVLLFVMLLALDWLSTTNFVQTRLTRKRMGNTQSAGEGAKQNKILLQPMLTLLEAPCDFCLRYMSVMFTPSFILIPAREIINGKEIGLITGWFAASQLLALIFPVLLHKSIRWVVASVRGRVNAREEKKLEREKKVEQQRRASVATLVAVMCNINGVPISSGTGAGDGNGGEKEGAEEKETKRFGGGEKLGSIATGLSGMTAIATAPLTITPARPGSSRQNTATAAAASTSRQDAQRQLEHVQLETARQQGDPYATAHTPLPQHHHHYPLPASSSSNTAPNSPRPASALHHNHRLHHSSYFANHPRGRNEVDDTDAGAGGVGRSRSLARAWKSRARATNSLSPSRISRRPRSGGNNNTNNISVDSKPFAGSGLRNLALPSARRPQSAGSAGAQAALDKESQTMDSHPSALMVSPTFDEYIFQTRKSLIEKRSSISAASPLQHDSLEPKQRDSSTEEGEEDEEEVSGGETLVMPTLVPTTPTRGSHDEVGAVDEKGQIRRPSKAESEMTISHDPKPNAGKGLLLDQVDEKSTAADEAQPTEREAQNQEEPEGEEEEEMDAVDRLVEKLWNMIPWFVFTLLIVVGLPLFYVASLSISLPLFLGINLVTFLFSITIIPAKLRRYAHPILTTSVLTVLILWAIGEIRGWSLKRTLNSYSVDAKYTVLWSLSGYSGPVIGAGDVLFSTLDAGIVSLAIPMYRYRWDLWIHFWDMLTVLFPCSMLSLFVWPTVAAQIGIAPERALAFASRFMSTPLAIELSLTIGADESITVVLVVITGILISIFKDPFFRLFGLDPTQDGDDNHQDQDQDQKKDGGGKSQDYLTIGIAMGSTAGAIGASSLISKPRCMAIASLSFVLFGAILLIFAAIPPIVETVRTLAGASPTFIPSS